MAKIPGKWWEEKDEYGYTYADKTTPGYMIQSKDSSAPGYVAPVEEELSEEALKEVMKRAKGGYEDKAGGDLPEETEVALEETVDTPDDSFKADFDEDASMAAGLRETKSIMAEPKEKTEGDEDDAPIQTGNSASTSKLKKWKRDSWAGKDEDGKVTKHNTPATADFEDNSEWETSSPYGGVTANADNLKDGLYLRVPRNERPKVILGNDEWTISENHMGKMPGSATSSLHGSKPKQWVLVNGELKEHPKGKYNYGWDMYGPSKIKSFLDGTITRIDEQDRNGKYPTGWGRLLEVRTDKMIPINGSWYPLYIHYGHAQADSFLNNEVGQRTRPGEELGTVGKTGKWESKNKMGRHLDIRGYVWVKDENGKTKRVMVSPQEFMPLPQSDRGSTPQQRASFKHGGEVKKYWEGGPALTAESGGSSAYDEEYLMSLSSDEIIDWREKNATILSDVQRTEVNEIIGNKKRREQNPENYIYDRPTGAADTGEYGEFYTQERTVQPGEEPGEWGELEKVKDPPNNMTVSEGVDLEWSDPSKEKGGKFRGKGAEVEDWNKPAGKKKEEKKDDFIPGKTQAELDHEQAQTAAKKEAAFLQQQKDLIQQEVKRYTEERDELVKIDPDRFWKNKGTVSKIAAILGSAAGAWISGRYGGPNKWQEMIEKEIDRDINSQKLDNDFKAKKKSAAFKRIEMLMKNYRHMTKNKEAQANLDLLLAKTKNVRIKHDVKTQKENQSSKDAIKMQSGLTDEELARYNARYPKQNIRKRAVKSTKTGLWYIFNDYDQKKKAMVSLVEGEKAINNIKDLKVLVKEIGIGTVVPEAFHGFDADLRRVKVLRESLKGALRLEIFGPGVMTDTERAIAEQVIGNPTKFWTTDKAELEMLETLQQKINYGIRQQLIRAGIHLPPSQNEAVIGQYLKSKGWANTDNNRAKTVTALIKLEKKHGTGTYWRPDEDLPL